MHIGLTIFFLVLGVALIAFGALKIPYYRRWLREDLELSKAITRMMREAPLNEDEPAYMRSLRISETESEEGAFFMLKLLAVAHCGAPILMGFILIVFASVSIWSHLRLH